MSLHRDLISDRVQTLVTRLSRVVKSRFGADARFDWLSDLSKEAQAALLSAPDGIGANASVADGVIFPVFSHYRLVGRVVITGMDFTRDPQAEEQMRDLVELYLDSGISLTDKIDSLEVLERQLEISRSSLDTDNVIPLRRTKAVTETTGVLRVKTRPRLGFALPTLIEGLSYTDLRQLALEIHDLSGRYAFLHLADLSWSSREDLSSLGPVTLYVPDIALLTITEQQGLLEFLRTKPGVECPQIIFGSLSSYKELRDSNLVEPELLRVAAVCHLLMDRPFAEYQKRGIVEFFFSGLVRDQLPNRLN